MVRFLHKQFYSYSRQIAMIFMAVLFCVVSSFQLPGSAEDGPDYFSPADSKVVKYYPNPATSFINFEFPQEIDKSYSLLVFSFVGKKMAEQTVDNSKIVLNLNDYFRGIYIFQLKDRTGRIIETGKFQVIK